MSEDLDLAEQRMAAHALAGEIIDAADGGGCAIDPVIPNGPDDRLAFDNLDHAKDVNGALLNMAREIQRLQTELNIDRAATFTTIDELQSEISEWRDDDQAWSDWSRKLIESTSPPKHRGALAQSFSNKDAREHIGRLAVLSRCTECDPKYDCFTGLSRCIRSAPVTAVQPRTIWATFDRWHNDQPHTKGSMVCVVVPQTVTVHSVDTLRMTQIVQLASTIGKHWRDQQGVNAEWIDRLADAVEDHVPNEDRSLDRFRHAMARIRNLMATSPHNWFARDNDAALWAIVVGCDDSIMSELQRTHRWTFDEVNIITRHHDAIKVALAE